MFTSGPLNALSGSGTPATVNTLEQPSFFSNPARSLENKCCALKKPCGGRDGCASPTTTNNAFPFFFTLYTSSLKTWTVLSGVLTTCGGNASEEKLATFSNGALFTTYSA